MREFDSSIEGPLDSSPDNVATRVTGRLIELRSVAARMESSDDNAERQERRAQVASLGHEVLDLLVAMPTLDQELIGQWLIPLIDGIDSESHWPMSAPRKYKKAA